jgi:SRSO17 transposase
LRSANAINCTTSLRRGLGSNACETELLVQADRLVGGSDAVLVIDDTAIAKKGTHSVGVATEYASALGKTANSQTLV